MTQENIKKFFDLIQNAQAITQKFAEIMEQSQGEEQNQKLAEFAQELGFEITAEELEGASNQVQDLDDQKLDEVVGGWFKPGQIDVEARHKEAVKAFEIYKREHTQFHRKPKPKCYRDIIKEDPPF